MIRLAFDIGGTFTDFVLQDYKTQKSYFLKISSTPSNPEMAVLSGLNQLIKKAKTTLTDVDAILHVPSLYPLDEQIIKNYFWGLRRLTQGD